MYIAYKRYRKHKQDKKSDENAAQHEASAVPPPVQPNGQVLVAERPVLTPDDEAFISRLLSEDGPTPPLPPRTKTPHIFELDSDSDSVSTTALVLAPRPDADDSPTGDLPDGSQIDNSKAVVVATPPEAKRLSRLSSLLHRKKPVSQALMVSPAAAVDGAAVAVGGADSKRSRRDLHQVLRDLRLSVKGDRAFPLSAELSELAHKFTLVLRDLTEGAPTAYGDLMSLVNDKDGTLSGGFARLPKSLQSLVAKLPAQVSSFIAPDLLAAAAKANGLAVPAAGLSPADAVKALLTPAVLQAFITQPGSLVTMLRAIVGVLKTRWPAFISVNILWSISVFLLLFVLWYCHKRGRETRIEKERTLDGKDRIEELPDDLTLPAPSMPALIE